jgi:hypothetical protein
MCLYYRPHPHSDDALSVWKCVFASTLTQVYALLDPGELFYNSFKESSGTDNSNYSNKKHEVNIAVYSIR